MNLSLAVSLVVLLAAPAKSSPEGQKALAAVDTALAKGQTHYLEYEGTTIEAGKERKLALTMRLKGEKSLLEFTSPADLKGTKVLVLSPTETYVYLPAFGKVRRVASHTSDQGLLGLAFSQEELFARRYSDTYQAVQDGASGNELRLTLTPAAGKSGSPKLQLAVARDRNLPTELKFFGADGKLQKTETRTGITCEGDVCGPGTRRMADHARNVTTTLVRKKWKVNEAMSDDLFSKRNLER